VEVSLGRSYLEREAYGKRNIEDVVNWSKRAPPVPVLTTCPISAHNPKNKAVIHTIVFSPAAKALVQIERSFAVPQLHIRKPFRYNI
jgi:hypothetical protein